MRWRRASRDTGCQDQRFQVGQARGLRGTLSPAPEADQCKQKRDVSHESLAKTPRNQARLRSIIGPPWPSHSMLSTPS